MKRSDFAYELPETLIARYPVENRTDSRLLVLDKATQQITHSHFKAFLEWVQPNDLIVLNNTKVFPARVFGQKATGGHIEILVEKIIQDQEALVHCKASKRPKPGQRLYFPENLVAKIVSTEKDLLRLQFNQAIFPYLCAYGHIPLPPYLHRADESFDKERYQTVYAKFEGSVAAPTAGLHFDETLLSQLNTAYITLHVGAGTFQSIRVENLDDHVMHAEYAELSQETCDKILTARSRGGRIIAVGTTTVRTLETAYAKSGKLEPFSGETNLFIKPGYVFKSIDALVTNFHLPESTLLMLVCAFGGQSTVMKAYAEAIENRYRFYSYGDAMLVI